MTDRNTIRNRGSWRDLAGLKTGLISRWPTLFPWSQRIYGDEPQSRIRDIFSLRFSAE
jgi:hypothetical protein